MPVILSSFHRDRNFHCEPLPEQAANSEDLTPAWWLRQRSVSPKHSEGSSGKGWFHLGVGLGAVGGPCARVVPLRRGESARPSCAHLTGAEPPSPLTIPKAHGSPWCPPWATATGAELRVLLRLRWIPPRRPSTPNTEQVSALHKASEAPPTPKEQCLLPEHTLKMESVVKQIHHTRVFHAELLTRVQNQKHRVQQKEKLNCGKTLTWAII